MNKQTIRNLTLVFAMLTVLVAVGCGKAPSATAPQAEATPTITVPVITAAPIVTYEQMHGLPFPNGETPPMGYTRVSTDENAPALFAFTDGDGAVCYRLYSGYAQLTDGVETEAYTGFCACDETGAFTEAEPKFIDPATEPFGACIPQSFSETLRLRDGITATAQTGVCRDATGGFFVYGAFGEGEPAFYPANESGAMIPGALKSEARLAVPAYVPTLTPNAEGERLLVVYIGSQTVVSYLAQDGEWVQERLMICSTGRRDDMTPRGEYAIVRQYLYKKMGEVSGENVYSQYASRITGSYLFHSVPIGGEKRYVQENGKKQMFIKYYERLGEPASGGCVRLLCADAFWIYTACEVGTRIFITDDAGPAAPQTLDLIYEEPYMDAKHEYGWDPTDPDPENPYHAIYEPAFIRDDSVRDKSDD